MPRFLTNAGFAQSTARRCRRICPSRRASDTLAAVFAFRRNQGDGWSYALNDLERLAALASTESAATVHGNESLFMRKCVRWAVVSVELHAVLARNTSDEAFRPERWSNRIATRWTQTLVAEANMTFKFARTAVVGIAETVQSGAQAVLDAREHDSCEFRAVYCSTWQAENALSR